MENSTTLWMVLPFIVSLIIGEMLFNASARVMNCQESDKKALLDLKVGLEDGENRLSTWQGNNCCEWWGIACDKSTRAVIAVDFHNPYPSGYDSSGRSGFWNLSGGIRPSLTRLKSLTYLDLSFNTFNGRIPDFFPSLGNLRYLNLSNAGFTGAVPKSFGNLSSLQVVDLSSNFLLAADSLDWVAGLVSLRYLAMTGSNLSTVGLGWVEAINKLPLLTELHLSSCLLSSFPHSLTFVNFTSLAVLDLSSNTFNSELPTWLANISSLVSLDVSFNSLYGRIPLGFGELLYLQSLRLRSNYNLTASCSQLLSGRWENVHVLDFALNRLHGRIPTSVGNMTSLIRLDLFHNIVTGGIPGSFGKLCNLQYLDLSDNNLTESLPASLEGAETCPSKSTFPSLQYFVSSDNRLIGNLPIWLCELTNLVVLNLQNNSLQGSIPACFGALQNLSELRLEANKLNGTLPHTIGQFSELLVLDVSINQLQGVITEEHFSRLIKLKILILSANSFVLNVSSSWIPPFQVQFLDMGSCHLGPSFPTWLRSQKQVNFLDFSNASISGSIPNWLWDMSSNMTLLNVSYNKFDGQLPNPLSIAPYADVDLSSNLFEGPVPLPNVEVDILDLSNNQFSGPIPEEIGKIMPYLVFLSMSNNKLIGSVPDSVGEMLKIEVIDLSSNDLTGSIPPSIGNCSLLKVLDLRNNKFTGVIPGPLGQLNLLQTLHLSNNNLSGEIPPSLHNLSSLETLDLGNNMLTGNILPWIGDSLTNLRILRLRSNDFSGEIPSALSNMSSLQVLDLAENNLNGTVPGFGGLRAMAQQQNAAHYLLYGMHESHYYEENLVVNTQGQFQKFTKTLSLLTCIDLSGNNLRGEFPEELKKLVGLEVLNLSGNHIFGYIPQEISRLQQLLSLDLSGNNLSGPIPPSMSTLSFLGYLNLSNNNFSGQIPYNDHLSTFDASSFVGNLGLCGSPLLVKCQGDDSNAGRTSSGGEISDNGSSLFDKWFYLSIGLGFAVGLLLPYFVLTIRRSWSNAYFGLVDKSVDRLLCMRRKKKATSRRIQP